MALRQPLTREHREPQRAAAAPVDHQRIAEFVLADALDRMVEETFEPAMSLAGRLHGEAVPTCRRSRCQ
jgi:hypothetical protein